MHQDSAVMADKEPSSDDTSKDKSNGKQRATCGPPAIPFGMMAKTTPAPDSGNRKEDAQYRKFTLRLDKYDPDSQTYVKKVKVFTEGKPYDWVIFCEDTKQL